MGFSFCSEYHSGKPILCLKSVVDRKMRNPLNTQLLSCTDYTWESKADGNFAVIEGPQNEPLSRGTEIRLHLKEEAVEYLEEGKLQVSLSINCQTRLTLGTLGTPEFYHGRTSGRVHSITGVFCFKSSKF